MYTSFWNIREDQTNAEVGKVLLSSKKDLDHQSVPFGNGDMKALGPISCAPGFIVAQKPGGGPLEEFRILKVPSMAQSAGLPFTSYGGVDRARSRTKKTKKLKRHTYSRSRSRASCRSKRSKSRSSGKTKLRKRVRRC